MEDCNAFSRQSAFIPDWQHLGGHGPREAAHPHVERGSEQHLQDALGIRFINIMRLMNSIFRFDTQEGISKTQPYRVAIRIPSQDGERQP